MTLLCGIDEAGRGPVIGPMAMAGVVIKADDEFQLRALGVRDSKELSSEKREELFDLIKDLLQSYLVLIITPQEIDRAVLSKRQNLNKLEAEKVAFLINKLKPEKAILDCPSVNLAQYCSSVKKMIQGKVKLLCEHKADEKYPVVAAASILAKVTRDREIEAISKKYNIEFGSGYPSDPETRAFLKKNFNRYPIFRKSWEPWSRLEKEKDQKRLFDF